MIFYFMLINKNCVFWLFWLKNVNMKYNIYKWFWYNMFGIDVIYGKMMCIFYF